MKIALISSQLNTYAVESFLRVLKSYQIVPDILNPFNLLGAQERPTYDLTINRIPTVLDNLHLEEFFLSHLMWGKEINPWQLKRAWNSKYKQYLNFLSLNIPTVPTLKISKNFSIQDQESLMDLSKNQTYIIKPNQGMQGRGVNKINSAIDLISWMETFQFINDWEWVVQPFLIHEKEFRVFFIHGQVHSVIEKKKDQNMKGNFYQGIKAILCPDDHELNLFLKNLKIPNCAMSGVDILKTEEGFKVIEINLTPGFEQIDQLTKGPDVATKVLESLLR
jgi:glutathione synthase/RimK-type ligase-like ATP-grasp enzyme